MLATDTFLLFCWVERTYRSINRLITLKIPTLSQTMMCLSKCHAGDTACYSTEIDRAETAKEAVLPGLRCRGGLGVDVLFGTGEDIVETVFPFIEIIVVNGTVVWSWSSH